jgi:hypothetical protein
MSTQSDVGLAIKTEAYRKLPVGVRAFLTDGFFETTLSATDGDGAEALLFYSSGCKWYDFEAAMPSPVSDLYEALEELEEDDFLLLEGCSDYPDSDEGCRGDYRGNPFKLSRNITVSVSFRICATSHELSRRKKWR